MKNYTLWQTEIEYIHKSKQELIDEIITMERYDLHNNAETDNPLDEIQEYRETLEKLPIEVLQSYIDEEITSDELYDNYISKL